MDLLERGQRSHRNDPRLEQLCWEDRLRELGCSAREAKLQGDLIVAFPDLKGLIRKMGTDGVALGELGRSLQPKPFCDSTGEA